MIFFLYNEQWPKDPIREAIAPDDSGQPWQIARTEDGLYVRFLGPGFLKPAFFVCQGVKIAVTDCLFMADKTHESDLHLINLVLNQETLEVWESLRDLIDHRLKTSPFAMKSELYGINN
jgi:hypothetical protein